MNSVERTTNEELSVVNGKSVDYVYSFNFKGTLFVIVLLAYVILVAFYVMNQKEQLLTKFQEYQDSQAQETILNNSTLAVLHSMTSLLMITDSSDRNKIVNDVHQQFVLLSNKYEKLNKTYPIYSEAFKQILQSLAATVTLPSNENLLELKNNLKVMQAALSTLLLENQNRRAKLVQQYHSESNRVALLTLFLGLTGLAVLGLVTSLFFHRLTRDIKSVHSNVVEIMNGDRKGDLDLGRQDELGSLVYGINHMTNTLSEKEKALEVEQKKALYREMMGTIEHLSGGLVHELGNPVAAISGLLNEIKEYDSQSPLPEVVKHNLEGIQLYNDRLLQINGDISSLATPISDNLEWVDLNQLVDSAVSLTRYDERWYGIEIKTTHGDMLPALQGYPEQILQAIMSCLSNAVESFEAISYRPPVIQMTTAVDNNSVTVEISDNGCGMSQEVKLRAFDAFFTTKGGLSGSGMGLPMTNSVIKNHGGKVLLESTQDIGTKVLMQFPINSSQ